MEHSIELQPSHFVKCVRIHFYMVLRVICSSRPTDVVMGWHWQFIGEQAFLILVKVTLKNGLYGFITVYPKAQCPSAGIDQPFVPGFLRKA
ncbi:hypothetical protein IM793_01155 [Pedobacter sp. MR2016-19]|uniref:hypothetical protein n=1 Tax=Pedobacter sp. MR2016-19 TaxID=2780089 RepID=UPI001876534D|nr:hypothetical protein [Pedobacter sp. MR2016-19]MBE5317751.1 hypothetical protein [Pedobacter sp. MR2016-19]